MLLQHGFELINLVSNLDIYIVKLILPFDAKPSKFSVRTFSECIREFLRNSSKAKMRPWPHFS